jgi:hypothetical protein
MGYLCTLALIAAASAPTCPQALLDEAMRDYVAGRYQLAIAKARWCTDAQPSVAYRVIGASACFLKDRATALDAWTHLDHQGRNFVKYVCSKKEIEIP